MALALTIAGVDVLDYLEPGPGNPGLDRALQTRTVFRFVLKDRAGLYRPVIRQEVIATLDGVRIFGGVTTLIDEGDFGDYIGNHFTCEAGDWATVLDTTEFNGIALGVTLKDVVQHLVTARLASRGFTVDPAMAAGPVINAQGYSFKYLTEIFDDLATISTWPWTVDAYKRILFAPAAARPAPFALTATNETINTIRVATGTDGYVNRVWLQYGAPGPREVTDTWHGDGSTKLFPTTFPNPEGVVSGPPTVLINGVTKPVAVWGVDTGYDWYWRQSDAALIQDFAIPTLTLADTLSGISVVNFPGSIEESNDAEIALYGEASIVETAPDVFDLAQARALAQGILRERGGLLRKITAVTHRPGLEPGHAVTVTVPERNLNGPFLLLSSRLVHEGRFGDGTDYWRFDLELVEGTQYRETWQKFFGAQRQGSGSAVSASGSVGSPPSGGGGGSATPVPPSVFAQSLGGSRTVAGFVPAAAPDPWIPIPNFADAFVDFDDLTGALQVSVQCRSHDPAVTVTPRVVSVDGSGNRAAVLATGAPTAATAWTYQAIPVAGVTGLVPIRVELTTSVRNRDAFVANARLDVF
jgi:hypothetical protein